MEIAGCENCKYRGLDETQEPCAHCTKNAVDNYEPLSNGDYIRSLSDAELAQIITCPSNAGLDEIDCRSDKRCVKCIQNWLESERKGEE